MSGHGFSHADKLSCLNAGFATEVMTTDTLPKLEDYSPEAVQQHVGELTSSFDADIKSIETNEDWKAIRDKWEARTNGILTRLNEEWLKAAPQEHKKIVGAALNAMRWYVKDQIEERKKTLANLQVNSGSERKAISDIDITLPGTRRPLGAEHPIIKTMNDIVNVFRAMGYSVGTGPEIETDYYNFESLNFPPNHPARDTQDTLFIAGQESKPQRERLLLRTHTSPVQIRTMERQKPPIRVVIPGKVHRSDTADATHSPVFHQVEGLAVDSNITFCDLKGTLDHAMKALFGSGVKTRFFPSFFPFTEPSADVAVSCFKCGGKGCRICKQGGWIELLGCGMVNPNVFEFVKNNGYDPGKISGFAFGMGVERIAMCMYEIDDIQLFYQGDVRFLEQFA